MFAFAKSSTRTDLFKNKNPNLPLPPYPIITHWRTWLAAVLYYTDNSDSVKSVSDELDKDDFSSIKSLQNLLKDISVRNELAYISANLSFLYLSLIHI